MERFPPRLVFKHSNVPSQSTFLQGKQIELCKSSTIRDLFQPMNYSFLSTSRQILQYLTNTFLLELSVEAPVPWMRSPRPLALSLLRIAFSLFSQHYTGAHSGCVSGHPKSLLSTIVFSLLYRYALRSCFLDASHGAVSKSSLCEWTWLTDGPGYSQLSQFCHLQTVSVVIFTFRSRLK